MLPSICKGRRAYMPRNRVLLIEWCFTPLSAVFQSYHGDNSHSCLSWVLPVLGWGPEVSCPRTLPRKKKPEDPERLEPRDPGLRVKHFSTEPRRTPEEIGIAL